MPKKPTHPKIKRMLVGPRPPLDWANDFCTIAPNLWVHEACTFHDFMYRALKHNWEKMQESEEDEKITILIWRPEEDATNLKRAKVTRQQANWEWQHLKNSADQMLRYNIQILSVFKVNKHGQVTKRKLPWRRYGGFAIGKLYSKATNTFFWTGRKSFK